MGYWPETDASSLRMQELERKLREASQRPEDSAKYNQILSELNNLRSQVSMLSASSNADEVRGLKEELQRLKAERIDTDAKIRELSDKVHAKSITYTKKDTAKIREIVPHYGTTDQYNSALLNQINKPLSEYNSALLKQINETPPSFSRIRYIPPAGPDDLRIKFFQESLANDEKAVEEANEAIRNGTADRYAIPRQLVISTHLRQKWQTQDALNYCKSSRYVCDNCEKSFSTYSSKTGCPYCGAR